MGTLDEEEEEATKAPRGPIHQAKAQGERRKALLKKGGGKKKAMGQKRGREGRRGRDPPLNPNGKWVARRRRKRRRRKPISALISCPSLLQLMASATANATRVLEKNFELSSIPKRLGQKRSSSVESRRKQLLITVSQLAKKPFFFLAFPSSSFSFRNAKQSSLPPLFLLSSSSLPLSPSPAPSPSTAAIFISLSFREMVVLRGRRRRTRVFRRSDQRVYGLD